MAGSGALARTGCRAPIDPRPVRASATPLCDEFLDLCTIHGENDPGEPRLARTFLARIEKGEVGMPTEPEWKPS